TEPGPAKLIAFLLALVTSRPELAHDLLLQLQPSSDALLLGPTVIALEAQADPPSLAPAPTELKDWLARNSDIANVTHRVAHRWAVEVARFSFKRLFDD